MTIWRVRGNFYNSFNIDQAFTTNKYYLIVVNFFPQDLTLVYYIDNNPLIPILAGID